MATESVPLSLRACVFWRDTPVNADPVRHATRKTRIHSRQGHPQEVWIPAEWLEVPWSYRRYKGGRLRRAPNHTESRLYSPVCFALRTLTPVRSRLAKDITASRNFQREFAVEWPKRYRGIALQFGLLRQHFPAKSDAAV
jgi:hypothetical protein